VTKPRDEAVAAPKFNVAAIDKTPGLVDRLGIIGAHQRLEPRKTPIKPNRISPVFGQPQSLTAEYFKGRIAFTDF
jgi:hypothetical protein